MNEFERQLHTEITDLKSKVDYLIGMMKGNFATASSDNNQAQQAADSPLFSDWLNKWYTLYKEPKLKPSSLRSYRRYIDSYIVPVLGSCILSNLSGVAIQEFLNNVQRDNFRIKLSNIIRASLDKAVKLRMIKYSPYDSVEVPRFKSEHYKPLNFLQQTTVLKSITNPLYKAVFWVMCSSGVRVGEFIAIDFARDINYAAKTINISKSVDILTNNVQTPKTQSSVRQIPFTDTLLPFIEQLREYQSTKGNLTYYMISCYFKRLYKKLQMKGLNLHSFRHTFISLCYCVEMREKHIQQLAGHSTLEMTMNTYTHILKTGSSPFLDYIADLWEQIKTAA